MVVQARCLWANALKIVTLARGLYRFRIYLEQILFVNAKYLYNMLVSKFCIIQKPNCYLHTITFYMLIMLTKSNIVVQVCFPGVTSFFAVTRIRASPIIRSDQLI